MKMQVKIMFALIAVFAMVSTAAPQETMKDSRDGKTYKTVKIGSQIWMAENLNYKTTNSYCHDNKPANCSKYGRLYSWSAAMDSVGKWSTNGKGCGYGETCSPTDPVRGVCPEGWHLPTELEFRILIDAVGGWRVAGVMLKSTTGWKDGNGTDDFGFSALPAGSGNGYGDFASLGYKASFWSSNEVYTEYGSFMHLYSKFGSEHADLDSDYKNGLLSVRCLRDRAMVAAPQETMKDSRDGKTYKTIKIGSQIWMAENLNYKTEMSYCYDDDPANCSKYGRLYEWNVALAACPNGWHLPTKAEFETLFDAVGGKKAAAVMFRSTTGWKDGNGTDDFGFSALPVGRRHSTGHFGEKDYGAYFWSSTEGYRSAYRMGLDHDIVGKRADLDDERTDDGLSVRCLRDYTIKVAKMVKESETAAEVSEKDSPKDLLPKELLKKLSNVKLTESDLSGYSAADLKIIRNAIYAKHGYIFKSEELKSYFEKYNWYKAQHTDVTKELSPIETANAKFIKSLESRDKTSEAKEK